MAPSVFYLNTPTNNRYKIPLKQISTDQTRNNLKTTIKSKRNFCGNEESIKTKDLVYYIDNGITIFCKTGDETSGILNFDINVDVLNIKGLCVGDTKVKIGSELINETKRFAKRNNCVKIKLTCYGNVYKFYQKNGFEIAHNSLLSADSDDSEASPKQSYEMIYTVPHNNSRTKSASPNTKTKAARRVTEWARSRLLSKRRTTKSRK